MKESLKQKLYKIVKDNIYIILILLFCCISFFWFKSDLIFNQDSGYINVPNEYNLTFSTWNAFNAPGTSENRRFLFNFGYILEYKILNSIFSYPVAQRLMLYFWLATCWIGMYFLSRVIKLKKNISFISGGLYTFNILTLVHIFSYGSGVSPYIFIPFIIALLIKGINENRGIFYALAVNLIWLFGFSASYVNPVTIITIFVFLFLYLLFSLFNLDFKLDKKLFYSKIKIFSFFIFTFIILNLFWLPNFLVDSKSEINTAFRYIESNASDKIVVSSYEPSRLFNLLGFDALFGSFDERELWYQFSPYYKNSLILFLSYLLPIIVFSSFFFFNNKDNGGKRIMIFWYITAVISIGLIGAAKTPGISKYFLMLMESSSFISTGYRNILTKTAPILMMSYAILFAFSVDCITLKIKQISIRKALLLLIFIIFIIILPLPLWKGEQFREKVDRLPSAHTKIPEYYTKAKEFLSNEKIDYRIAVFPVITGAHIELGWEDGYSGRGPFSELLMKPAMSKNSGISYDPYMFLGSLLKSDKINEQIPILLSFYNTKYIIFAKDIDWEVGKGRNYSIPNNLEELEIFFDNQDFFEYLGDIGKLGIYKIKEESFLPHFYVPQSIVSSDTDLEYLPEIVDLLERPESSAVYFESQSVNNSNEVSRINGLKKTKIGEMTNIIFSNNSFESGLWQEKPADCANGLPGKADLSMQIVNDSVDGEYSMELGAKSHTACISKNFNIELLAGKKYKYSFYYKNVKGGKGEYYYQLYGEKKSYPYSGAISVDKDDHEWKYVETTIQPNENIKEISLYFYAASDGEEESINRFDSLNITPIELKLINETNDDDQTPVLEFKKINPTKYKIIVHDAKGSFPLIFSESFHDEWKVYLSKNQDIKIKNQDLENYKILDGNEGDQASREELENYIERGWISSLGNGGIKEIKHKKQDSGGKEKLDYIEEYNIDFISKNFQGTIQNDNLKNGKFYETWLKDPLPNENHLVANGYANSWIINTDEICGVENSKCIKNIDGTYDFELVVEFWPQRLFYLGLGISGAILIGFFGYLLYDWRKNKKRRAAKFIYRVTRPTNHN